MSNDTLSGRLIAAAARSGARTAVRDGERSISYWTLLREARELAARWNTLAAGRDPVAVLAPPTASHVVGLVAAALSGRPHVAVDAGYPPARIAQMLQDSGARILSGPPALVAGYPADAGFCADPWPTAATAVDFMAGPGSLPSRVTVAPADLAYVAFTSGSTGRPRAVGVEHRSIVNFLDDVDGRRPLHPAERATWWCSSAFDVSAWEVWSALTAGAELHVIPEALRWDPDGFVSYLTGQGIQSAFVPRSYLAALLAKIRATPQAKLTRLLVGVEPIPLGMLQDLKRAQPGLQVLNGYGPAETTVCCTLYAVPVSGGDPSRRAPVGTAVQGMELRILDAGRLPVAAGEVGELYVAGVGVARGYLNDERANQERFVTGLPGLPGRRFYRTGDLVRELPGGALEFVGRHDRQFKVRGYRVEAAEVEGAAAALPGVREAVAGTISPDGVTLLALYVVAEAARTPPRPTEVRTALSLVLPRHAVPSVVVVLDALPQTRNGKIDHDQLGRLGQAAWPSGPTPPGRAGDGDGARERRPGLSDLFELWAHAVGMDPAEVDPHAGFVALGGTSAGAVRLTGRLGGAVDVIDVLHADSYTTFERLVSAAPRAAGTGEAAGGDEEPATPTQESILVAAELSGNPLAYAETLLHRIDGTAAVGLVTSALSSALAALPVLRTRIGTSADGRPTYRFGAAPAAVSVIPAGRRPSDEILRHHALSLAVKPWDLAAEPPCRAAVLADHDEASAIIVVVHHAAFDGRTAALFTRVLADAAAGHAPMVTEGPDLADWLARRSRDEVNRGPLDAVVAGVRSAPAPRAPLRADGRAEAGWPVLVPVNGLDHALVARAAQERRVTPFVLLAAAAQRALAEIAGRRRFVMLTPVDARDGTDLQIGGCLIGLLPMVADASPGTSPGELLRHTSEQVRTVLEARRFALPEVLGALPAGELSDDPVAFVSFSVNVHPALQLPQAVGTWVPGCFPYAKFGLDLVVEIDSSGRLHVLVQWQHADVDSGAAIRLAAAYGDQLRALCPGARGWAQ